MFDPVLFRAESEEASEAGVAKIFVEMIENEIRALDRRFGTAKEMIFGKEEEKVFKESKKCWICGEEFKVLDLKVRDQCHFSGKFRGAAHSKCNLQFRKPNFTPVFFQNLSGYGSYIFISQL